ncbi:galanin receptor 2a-like [Patiria miniata]|uniref:G-protein coupled receptors family 1 profile domain-containing protein n=1 Tax=Patiria miniata TaxID=46514 RepID=A0A913ZXF1_PATMI|nr:galanin receptor 2a-like [Patiria miniata]
MANSQDIVCDIQENFTSEEETYLNVYDAGDRFAIEVVYPCIMALGIITNGAFCIVLSRVKQMRNVTNLYLVNLALADMTFLIVAVSEKLARIIASPVQLDKTLYGLAGCILIPFIVNCTYFASIFIVTLVSIEKFYAICRPLQHRRISSFERTVKLLIGAWMLSILCSCTFIPGRANVVTICVQWPADYADIDLPSVVTLCTSINVWNWFQHVSNFLQSVPFFVAAAANTVMYVKILKTMHRRVGAQDDLTEMNNKRVQVRNQVAAMLVANGLVFFLCQMLFQCVSVALAFRHLRTPPILTVAQIDKALLVARILTYLNSAVNAIIYNIVSSRYRSAFKETFCWRKARRVHPRPRVNNVDNNQDLLNPESGQSDSRNRTSVADNSRNRSLETENTLC